MKPIIGDFSLPKFNFKTLIIIILVLLGLYFLLPKLVGLETALKLLLKIDKLDLFLALVFEIASYAGAALLIGVILKQIGYKVPFFFRLRLAAMNAFAIHFLPIGTLGQGAANFFFLKKKRVKAGSILLYLVLQPILIYVAFLIIFLVGLALVPTAPNLPFSPKIVAGTLALVLLSGVLYIVYLYNHKQKFFHVWQKLFRFIAGTFSKIVGQNLTPEQSMKVFEDIYLGIGLFGAKKRVSVYAVCAALLYWLGDIFCFYFVFLSFGYMISLPVLIFGYGVATLAGLISFIPGGLGVTEGTLGLIYSGLGVPTSVAILSILVYRLISFWLWIPVGLFSYLSLAREIKKSN